MGNGCPLDDDLDINIAPWNSCASSLSLLRPTIMCEPTTWKSSPEDDDDDSLEESRYAESNESTSKLNILLV